MGCFVHFFV
jgi:small subunit ribosomal protein S9e